jgi:UDP-2-acetamido-2,6-beta-L-arabino-hexul-4-ose reductase
MIRSIYIVGGSGFIGQNLFHTLRFNPDLQVTQVSKEQILSGKVINLTSRSALYLLSGVSRAENENEFYEGNVTFLQKLLSQINSDGHELLIVHASSIMATDPTDYGKSKMMAESLLLELGSNLGYKIVNLRIPNVFGKWSRPNHNSVVATFCSKIANGDDLTIHNPDSLVDFIYVDNLVSELSSYLFIESEGSQNLTLTPEFSCTISELALRLKKLGQMRITEVFPKLHDNFDRMLYSTLITYFPISQCTGTYRRHLDMRGSFAELSRDVIIGQVSFATCLENQERGRHFHHSKVERFVPLDGSMRIQLSNIRTEESLEIEIRPGMWVETIPGWVHTVSSITGKELNFLIWANENFDRDRTDTYSISAGRDL